MTPTVSVIIPSYNHGAYLRECIESVIWQSLTDWELLVIDDWSSDDSLEIANRFEDPRIKVFKNEQNLGTYGTENVGLQKAAGKYIAILNSDDLWLPTKLEKQVALLEKHPECTFSYTGSQLVDEEGKRVPASDIFHSDYPTEEVQDLLPYLLFENRVLASSVVFRKGAVKFNPLLKYSGDWIALLGLAEQGKAAYVNEPLTVWRQHDSNSYTRLQNVLPEEIRVREAILSKREKWQQISQNPEQVDHRLCQSADALAALYLRIGKTRLAKQWAKAARSLNSESKRAKQMNLLHILPAPVARMKLWKHWSPLPVQVEGAESQVFLD